MSGQPVTVTIGDLPRRRRHEDRHLQGHPTRQVCNTAVADSSNAGKVNAEACTVVQQPGVKIVKSTSDAKLLINRTASYNINVKNTGDTTLTGVVVTDTRPAGTTIVEAVGGSASGSVATWNIGEPPQAPARTSPSRSTASNPATSATPRPSAPPQGLKDSSPGLHRVVSVTGVCFVEVVDDPRPDPGGRDLDPPIKVTNQSAYGTVDELGHRRGSRRKSARRARNRQRRHQRQGSEIPARGDAVPARRR